MIVTSVLPFNIAICLFLITLAVSMLHTRKKNAYIKEISGFLLLSLFFNFCLILVRFSSLILISPDINDIPFSIKVFLVNTLLYFGSRVSLGLFFKNIRQKFTSTETKKSILSLISIQVIFFCISLFISNSNSLFIFAIAFLFLGSYWEFHQLYLLQKSNKNTFITWSCVVILLKSASLLCVLIFLIHAFYTHELVLLEVSFAPTAFFIFKGSLFVIDLIIFTFINAFLFEQVNEFSKKTTDENTLIKNLLIQQTSLTEGIQNSNKFIVSGALSASIAHELSHPLASIQANTEILKMQLSSKQLLSADIQVSVTKILRDTQRAGHTLKALKGLFSVKKELSILNINEVIRLSIDLVSSTIKQENIKLKLQLAGNIPSIMGNPQELQQVLLNLLSNAIQAIQKQQMINGEIVIKTLVDGNFIVLSISDNGHGFSIDQEDNVFELLRTTKKEGMGFGLWLSKFILEKNFGSIDLINHPSIGATLIIKLPIHPPLQGIT